MASTSATTSATTTTTTTTTTNDADDSSSSSSEESTEFNRSAVQAVRLHLLTSPTAEPIEFAPIFAHQLFPKARIVGFKDPVITLAFAHDSLVAHASVAFAGRAPQPPITNIARRLRDFSPSLAPIEFDRSAFVSRAFESAAPFRIPGALLTSFAVGDDRFEVYYGSLDDQAMRVYVARASVFLPFFIERASYIKPEPNWLALLIFQRRSADVVSFVGLLTLYRWLMPLTARERWRVSQVLVLPPFQRRGHGARLLRAVYQLAAMWPNGVSGAAAVDDITVEEPSPEFTQMRDTVDLEMLVAAKLLPMVESGEMQPTRWRVPGEPRTLVSNDGVLATCRAVRERFRLCDVQTRRLIRAARYLNSDPTRAAEEANGAEADVARPQTLSLRERWCAARHWRVYGEPLARMQRLQASAAILREHENAAASGVEQVIEEWGEEAEMFERLRATFERAKAKQSRTTEEGVES